MGAGTELGRVRGLGAAKDGVHHWWLQRVTAVANIVLVLWFVVSLVRLPSSCPSRKEPVSTST